MAEIEVIDSSGLLTEEELHEFIRHAGHIEHPREMIIDNPPHGAEKTMAGCPIPD